MDAWWGYCWDAGYCWILLAWLAWLACVQEWDIDSREVRRTFAGHKRWVRSLYPVVLDASPTGPAQLKIVSASWDDSLIVWDLLAQDPSVGFQHLTGGHELGINAAWFDPATDRIYSGSDDRSICVWEPTTGALIDRLDTDQNVVSMVGISTASPVDPAHGAPGLGESSILFTGLSNGNIVVWDLPSGESFETLTGHSAEVTSLIVAHGYLFSAGNDQVVYQWDLGNYSRVKAFSGHTGYVSSLAWYVPPNGGDGVLVSGSWDGTVRIWDPTSGRCVHKIQVHNKSVGAVEVDNSRSILFTGTSDGLIKSWDLGVLDVPCTSLSGEPLQSFHTPNSGTSPHMHEQHLAMHPFQPPPGSGPGTTMPPGMYGYHPAYAPSMPPGMYDFPPAMGGPHPVGPPFYPGHYVNPVSAYSPHMPMAPMVPGHGQQQPLYAGGGFGHGHGMPPGGDPSLAGRHPPPPAGAGAAAAAAFVPSSNGHSGAHGGGGPAGGWRPRPSHGGRGDQVPRPCVFFQRGNCRFGEQCRNLHEPS
ncbi:WD40-repeat-containing domain protein [Entophlyctis helioformis]|nr:WD40-repeat-containing domain protein [Entophlyctis helioformis]